MMELQLIALVQFAPLLALILTELLLIVQDQLVRILARAQIAQVQFAPLLALILTELLLIAQDQLAL